MSQSVKILYAENDIAHLTLTKRLFASLDLPCYTIEHFNNGKELLEHLHRRLLDKTDTEENIAILLDLKMPIMGGVEALKEIKQNPQLRDLPTIIFTTSNNQEELNKCYDLGCDGCFEKTFNPEDIMKLYDLIRKSLAKYKVRN